MKDDKTLKDQLRIKHPEFRRLFDQHAHLDEQITRMLRRKDVRVISPVK